MAPLYRNDLGREIFASGKEAEDRYAADSAWSLVVEPPFPDGPPAEKWKVEQLKAYAESKSYDLGGATTKGDILKAVTAADEAAAKAKADADKTPES